MHGLSDFFWKSMCFQVSHCVCVCRRGQGGGDVCWGVCGCAKEICMKKGHSVGLWMGGWVLEKWLSLYSSTHYNHEYSALSSIWPKSGLSGFGEKRKGKKKTLYNCHKKSINCSKILTSTVVLELGSKIYKNYFFKCMQNLSHVSVQSWNFFG